MKESTYGMKMLLCSSVSMRNMNSFGKAGEFLRAPVQEIGSSLIGLNLVCEERGRCKELGT
eukprot:645786-Pelagomonas_calceolata.AAC.2